ncbi:Eco57I restriction-modification methylase domain-containing protein [Fusobacterium necrophorum subsp. funduliforme]
MVVSAKADVKDEWKKTVEGAGNFSEYVFLEAYDLSSNENIIEDTRKENKKVVIFLTLQDLQGDAIKDKHKELLGKQINLLIVDETHFGARAESFGKILENAGYEKSDKSNIDKLDKVDKNIDVNIAREKLKQINASIRLHLSGTPYRILMGNEFEKEDIISFVQFSDIVKEQEEWDKNNLNKDDINEWDNPYYGFPQMVRFAFNPNKSSREKMEALKRSGVTFAFSKLFEPESIKKDTVNNGHKKFKNETEILELLQVIDGSKEDENLLGFLDYDKIKEGKMCRHMVMVLPYCASCDAMEELLSKLKDTFKNLGEYEIINISGVDAGRIYKKPNDIKNKIKECEDSNKKTITLTVNRMLTGSTVEQWDTMLYFKDTSSPQEYDQSIFRLQNQYIRTLSSANGFIKENLKPQTLLVDFDPDRLFRMQEQKSLIYNVNTEENGNSKLKERIVEELRISPVIMMNHNKIKEVDATNILEAISEYNNQRSVSDEVLDIPVDLSILNDETIREVIAQQAEFGSKQGLTIDPNQGEGDELDIDETVEEVENSEGNQEKPESKDYIEEKSDKEIEKLESQIKTYYQRILFFSFLTKDKVASLDDILSVIDTNENIRLSKNLLLNKGVIEKISKVMDPFKRSRLDYKIQNISMLACDESVAPLTRAMTSIKKFNRMSESEVITPSKVCDEMVGLLLEEGLKEIVSNQDKLLDIASKSGEYAVSLYKRLTSELGYSHEDVRDIIYSIPTSSVAYEFTRRFYEILDINVENIAAGFNAYDLIDVKNDKDKVDYEKISGILKQEKPFSKIELKDKIKAGEKAVRFGAVIGNPPYQENSKDTSDKPIYNYFMDISYNLSDFTCLITPARFLFNAGKTSKEWNTKMLKDKHFKVELYEQNSSKVFDGVDLKGGLVISTRNKKREEEPINVFVPFDELKSILNKVISKGETYIDQMVYSPESYKFTRKLHEDNPNAQNKLSKGHMYDITTNIFSKLSNIFFEEEPIDKNRYFKFLGLLNGKRTYRWIKKEYISNHENLLKYKILIPKSNGSGAIGEVLSTPLIGHTQSFISVGSLDSKVEAVALLKYVKTKFARTMLGTLKITQDNKKSTWANVPMQDFSGKSDIDWSKSIHEIDLQLYKKYNLSNEEIQFIESKVQSME